MQQSSEDEINIDRKNLMLSKKIDEQTDKINRTKNKEKQSKKRKLSSEDDIHKNRNLKTKENKMDYHLKSQEFVSQMRDIVIQDNENNEQNKPATNKLSQLDNLYKTCVNIKLQPTLIENDILSVIKMWLEPLPDKTLPNVLIRKTLLQLLLNMKIKTQDLKNSQIGKIIHFYSLNPNEIPEIKKVANFLIQKWCKIILTDEKREEEF
ncbi:hypothetical protein H312_02833 [Anncaliia algerae PRA339]|uniref:TFIIS N-terminal domain-containing protein n=1 Tax=Anncaliia algerae PRA339 TaxID=1288291 RepID=A0A059EYH7_9MICR|nr:hypothetical protein H312_02833 [Anncaliia algerae PRA339]